MGWIGSRSELFSYLSVVGADRDSDGNFLIFGADVSTYLGLGEEFVIPAETEYSVGGERKRLAAGLATTSYGMCVSVIY